MVGKSIFGFMPAPTFRPAYRNGRHSPARDLACRQEYQCRQEQKCRQKQKRGQEQKHRQEQKRGRKQKCRQKLKCTQKLKFFRHAFAQRQTQQY